MSDSSKDPLRALLNPRSIAIVGASENSNKIGGRPLLYLRKHGYRGKVYPINPNRKDVQKYKCFPTLGALPEIPEVAIIAVPGEAAVEAVQTCAQAGVKAGVIFSSGFGETSDPKAIAQQQQMARIARETGMRLIGPNSQGLANFGNGAVLNFSTMFIETPAKDGPIGIISQSGAMSVVPYALLRARGLGIRHCHATGNDADANVAELAAVVAEDPDLKLLLLYLENIRDARALADAAAVARERNLPVIALKSGRTQAGQDAARSHTGALANEDRVVDAFLAQHGIARARDVNEWVNSAELYLRGWKPKGRNLVVISNSGAICVMAADVASEQGMPLATLSQSTREDLNKILPSFATTTNPIDLTAALLTNSALFSQILPVIAKDPAADAFHIGIPVAGEGYDVAAFAADSAVFAKRTGKPVVVSAPQALVADRFKAQGMTVFTTESEAVTALNQYLTHLELIQRVRDRNPHMPMAPLQQSGELRMLDEVESLRKVAQHNLSVVGFRHCEDSDAAVAAFREFNEPVVLKGCSPTIAHKSEWGLVKVGVDNEDDVRRHVDNFFRTLRMGGAVSNGSIVARQVKGQRELMLGGRIDPIFGPVVLVGDGGKYVEAMPDLALLVWPFDESDVRAALKRLRIAPLFDGIRGDPAMDVWALTQACVGVGRMLADPDSKVVNFDLNPLILGAEGEGYQIVDAVVYVSA
ncbi:MAG: acetate--CoA ligase family protein [Betaproteobacteria bacterium]|nr:acetate--CoA ligase family protein [Betaproteobacteria bacterium]